MQEIIPDAIEPVYGWRGWELRDGYLTSPLKKTLWQPLKAIQAECVPCSPGIISVALAMAPKQMFSWQPHIGPATTDEEINSTWAPFNVPPRPGIVLPAPFNWVLRVVEHDQIPSESCNCGIHALKTNMELSGVYTRGRPSVIGKVACWGKVIEGSKGYRSEFAYPSELYILGNDGLTGKKIQARLSAYRVPVQFVEELIEVESPEARQALAALHDRIQKRAVKKATAWETEKKVFNALAKAKYLAGEKNT